MGLRLLCKTCQRDAGDPMKLHDMHFLEKI
jgi:hypothetical protein